MAIQLPPDVAKEKQMQAMQQNQLYSMAFQIYTSLLGKASHPDDCVSLEQLAMVALEAARVFIEQVKKEQQRGKGD